MWQRGRVFSKEKWEGEWGAGDFCAAVWSVYYFKKS
jgi:hypothetical protein